MSETTKTPRRRQRRKKIQNIGDVKSLFSNLLPTLIQSVVLSYENFSETETAEDAKGFAAHHAACKAALSHVELLTKLARWAEGEEENKAPILSEDEEIAGLIAGARSALQELDN